MTFKNNDENSTCQSHSSKAVGSVKWTFLMEVVSRTASPIVLVVLARLLSPSDFGIIATAMIAISLLLMFCDAGLNKALIQTHDSLDDAANVVFWTNTFLGIFIYILLFFGAQGITSFFKTPASAPVLRVLGLQIILASFSTVQQALFVRDLNFRRLFRIKLLTAFTPGLFSIPLAFFGYGVWALVAGSLAGQALNLWLLWQASPWRPQLRYSLAFAAKMYRFGFWVLAEAAGGWLIMWGDGLFVGRYFGVHDLGVYRTAIMIVTVIFGLSLNSFLPVLYPTFSRMQHDHSALLVTFHKAVRLVMALAIPMGLGLFLMGEDISHALFGDKWKGLGFVLSMLGLKEGLTWAVGINPDIYRAINRPDINTKFMIAQILYFLPSYYIAAKFGIGTFVYIRVAVAIVAIPMQVYICHKSLKISLLYLWHDGKSAIISSAIMASIIYMVKYLLGFMMQGYFKVIILATSGIFSYIITLLLIDKNFLNQLLMMAKRIVGIKECKHI